MVTLVFDIPDKMLAFIDRQVVAGRALNRSDYVRSLLEARLLAQSSEPDCYIIDGKIVFANDEQRRRLEETLDEAFDEFEQCDFIAHNDGDCVSKGLEYLQNKRVREIWNS